MSDKLELKKEQLNSGELEDSITPLANEEEQVIVFGRQKQTLKKDQYIAAIGRRKTSNAQVRLFFSSEKKTGISVNERSLEEYFPTSDLQKIVLQPLHKTKYPDNFKITVVVRGGGISSQAQAVRHGLARAVAEYDPETRTLLKRAGFLKRDSRAVERKKFGKKKARKSSQWSKR